MATLCTGHRSIQREYISLHAKQVTIAVGASGDMIAKVAAQLIVAKITRINHVEEILIKMKNK